LLASVVIGGVLMAGMVAVAWHAARVLPAGARVPLNAGVPEYSLWLPKIAGLAAWLAAGAVTFAAVAIVTLDSRAANWATSLRVVLLPCAMFIVLAAQAGAVIYAQRQVTGPGRDPEPGTGPGADLEPGGDLEPGSDPQAEASADVVPEASGEAR
jgi:hypothetical protein